MHDDGYFDEHVAAAYDDPTDEANQATSITPVVDLLAELAGSGPALEFAIGTGRIALPLAARGVPVHGIELSSAMAARLRAKPGGDRIPVTIGDIAGTRVDGPFTLVYLVYNTIMNLTSQAAQVACFRNAAAHLVPGGRFVIEVGIPELRRLSPGDVFRAPYNVTATTWSYDEYDVARQGLISHHMHVVDGRLDRGLDPVPVRLAGGARSHGRAGRPASRASLGDVDQGPVHERERGARLGLDATRLGRRRARPWAGRDEAGDRTDDVDLDALERRLEDLAGRRFAVVEVVEPALPVEERAGRRRPGACARRTSRARSHRTARHPEPGPRRYSRRRVPCAPSVRAGSAAPR